MFCLLIFISVPVIVLSARQFTSKIDWKLPADKHILFMGASHIECGINDSLTHSAINLSKSSERYMFTYIKLQHILEYNNQIDTIFLQCAPTDLFEHADDKYYKDNEMAYFFSTYYPLFNYDQWKLYKEKIPYAFVLLYRRAFVDYILGVDYSYYCDMFLPRREIMKLDSVYYKPEGGTYGNTINYIYLRKIIQLCRENNIKLYFIYCPVYKPENFYDQNYYYEAYRNNFGDIELLDYSHYQVSVDEYCDAHHLNYQGAVKFTNYLKKEFNLK